jgi:hypothetical protein
MRTSGTTTFRENYTGVRYLIVGCTTDATITESSSFSSITTLNLEITKATITDVLTFPASTFTPSYCSIVSTEITDITNTYSELTSGTLTSGSSTTGVALAASCGSTSPCYKVDISENSKIQTIRFRVKTTLNGEGKTAYSSYITVNVKCLSTTATISSTLSTFSYEYKQSTTDKTYSFSPFTCDIPICCQTMTYKFVSTASTSGTQFSTTSMTVPSYDSTSGSSTYGKYKSTVDVSTLNSVFTFYVYAENEYGTKFVDSKSVTIKIVPNCDLDKITRNTSLPVYPETYYGNYSLTNSLPMITLNQTQYNMSIT